MSDGLVELLLNTNPATKRDQPKANSAGLSSAKPGGPVSTQPYQRPACPFDFTIPVQRGAQSAWRTRRLCLCGGFQLSQPRICLRISSSSLTVRVAGNQRGTSCSRGGTSNLPRHLRRFRFLRCRSRLTPTPSSSSNTAPATRFAFADPKSRISIASPVAWFETGRSCRRSAGEFSVPANASRPGPRQSESSGCTG